MLTSTLLNKKKSPNSTSFVCPVVCHSWMLKLRQRPGNEKVSEKEVCCRRKLLSMSRTWSPEPRESQDGFYSQTIGTPHIYCWLANASFIVCQSGLSRKLLFPLTQKEVNTRKKEVESRPSSLFFLNQCCLYLKVLRFYVTSFLIMSSRPKAT